jgi:type IX secretion system PorP/SprF family membrane protein
MKTILTILLIVVSLQLNAQQDPISTLFWNNYAHFNPAMSALDYKHQGSATYRKNYASLTNGYNTVFANYNMLLGDNHGVGINYLLDEIGITTNQTLNLNYNYQIRIDDTKCISIGVATGFFINKIEPEWVPPTVTFDPVLLNDSKTTSSNSNIGVAYSSDKLQVGVGITHLFNNWSRQTGDPVYTYVGVRNYYLHAHYKIAIGENFEIRPQAILRTDASFISSDVNLLFTLMDRYWVGASYRNSNGLAVMIGWDIMEKFRLSYSYDRAMSSVNNGISGSSHEFGLGILLK